MQKKTLRVVAWGTDFQQLRLFLAMGGGQWVEKGVLVNGGARLGEWVVLNAVPSASRQRKRCCEMQS